MSDALLYPRAIEPRLQEAMQDTPVVLLAGPRQAGKTTLVRQVAAEKGLRYLTLDDDLVLMSAREDPVGMVRDIDRAVERQPPCPRATTILAGFQAAEVGVSSNVSG
jgi:predicted AAA+ superfamily ATPase